MSDIETLFLSLYSRYILMQEIGINSTFKKLIYESLEMLADNTSTDNLKGFTEAIRAVFPESTKQICIVYQIRNSCSHLVCKDRKAFAVAMKSIYTSPNRNAAALALDHLEAVWGSNTALFNHQLV